MKKKRRYRFRPCCYRFAIKKMGLKTFSNKVSGNKGRSSCKKRFLRFLKYALLSSIISPAFISSCVTDADLPDAGSGFSETVVRLDARTDDFQDSDMDLFIFNDDRLRRLDSYQRIDAFHGNMLTAASRRGNKIIVAIANSHRDRDYWKYVNSYDALENVYAILQDENPDALTMTGEIHAEAGSGNIYGLEMEPLVSMIHIESFVYDFRGKPYEGAVMENISFFLTNVNSGCGLLKKNGFRPEYMLNIGNLSESDMSSMKCPEILAADCGTPAGSEIDDVTLYCYPNESEEESIGSAFTRLVVRGDINGCTYYYPLDINRGEDAENPGIGRNRKYVFNIRITQTGGTDPDSPVSPAAAGFTCSVEDWNETDGSVHEF